MEANVGNATNLIAPRHNHPSSCDFVDSPRHQPHRHHDNDTATPRSARGAESEFWNRKGVIKMDPNNHERCSHTTIPPSAMMTLAMELQVSNRGKASKIFRKAKSNARVASPENSPIENEKSMLPELWVVPESSAKTSSEEPTTASHLQPSLDKSDFVFRPGFESPVIQNRPEQSKADADGLNSDELEFLESINVADMVGSKDNVIVYPDSDQEEEKESRKYAESVATNHNKGSDVITCIDRPNADNQPNTREADGCGSRKCKDFTTTNHPTGRDYKPDAKGSVLTGSKAIEFIDPQSNAEASNVIAALKQRNNVSIKAQEGEEVEQCRHVAAAGVNKSIVTSSLTAPVKDSKREKQPNACDVLPTQSGITVDSGHTSQESCGLQLDDRPARVDSQQSLSRDRAQSLSHKREVEASTENRSATPEDFRTSSQNGTLSSTSLSSSLFSLSSLGSVSSTSLYFSSINGASEKTSVASCTSITPDSLDAQERRRPTSKGRENFAKPKQNSPVIVEPVARSTTAYYAPSQFAVASRSRPENRSVAMQSTVKYNPHSCSGGGVRNADDDTLGSRRSPLLQAPGEPQQQPTLVTSRSSSRVRVRSCDGSVSPSRKVICEFVDQDAPALPDQLEIKGRIVSKAVFPDEQDPSLVSPVLHLQRENGNCVKCKGQGYKDKDKMISCCCCGPKPRAPPRGDSKGATDKFTGAGRTPSPVPAVRRRTPSHSTTNSDTAAKDIEVRTEVVEATESHQVSASPKRPAARPRSSESPAKNKPVPTSSLRNKSSLSAEGIKLKMKPDPLASDHYTEGCRITLASPSTDKPSQKRVVVKNTLTPGVGNPRVSGTQYSGSNKAVLERDGGRANIEHPRVNVVGGSKITLLNADSEMNCAFSTAPRSLNKAQYGLRLQPESAVRQPDKKLKQESSNVAGVQENAHNDNEAVVVSMMSETQTSQSVHDKAPAVQGPKDKNDSQSALHDKKQGDTIEAASSPHNKRSQNVKEAHSVKQCAPVATKKSVTEGKSSPSQLETIVAEPKYFRFQDSKARVGSPHRINARNNEQVVESSAAGSVFVAPPASQREVELPQRRMVKRSQSLGSGESASGNKPVYCNTVTLKLRSPTGKKQDGMRYVSPTPPKPPSRTIFSASTSKGQGSSAWNEPEIQTGAQQDYKKWQGQSNNFQEVSVAPTVISRHRQIQDQGKAAQGNQHHQSQVHGHHKVTFNPQVSVRAFDGSGKCNEGGCSEGSRKESGKNSRQKTGMIGTEEGNKDKMMAPPHSATDDEDFSGVVEPPPIKVKDIRAMFKRGPDYQDYAKPRSLSASNAPARRGSGRAASHGSQSDAEICDDISTPDTQVAKQVMHLFKGALDIEKDLDVFEEETLRKQQELTNDVNGTNNHQMNGQVVTGINNNYVTKVPPQTLPKPNKNASPSRLSPPSNDEPPASPSDIKSSIAQIKIESEEVASFDESLDKFYDVLNDLTS